VAAQQRKLNELFAGTGLPALTIDGVAGPFTRQQLCAARMALNLPISRSEMPPGSAEEQALMAATSISAPPTAAVFAGRWILIDKTCQVLFAGDGGAIVFVFKTSTGEPGWETRNHEQVHLYRYNPAVENGGWHNSSRFPVAEDNPLNGNMYRPLYFDQGQAIHGANNVPPQPASKGCARLRVENQDALVAWLGLGDVTQQFFDTDRINATVTVQGEYVA
jgi:lipoprotein-anchoring transpeptidase ErfK/SrfK